MMTLRLPSAEKSLGVDLGLGEADIEPAQQRGYGSAKTCASAETSDATSAR